jgi:hypothetical protein
MEVLSLNPVKNPSSAGQQAGFKLNWQEPLPRNHRTFGKGQILITVPLI